jgi:hypothetical protein
MKVGGSLAVAPPGSLQVPQWPGAETAHSVPRWRTTLPSCCHQLTGTAAALSPSDGNDAVERKTELMNRTLKSLVLSISILLPAGAFAASPDGAAKIGEHRGHHRGGFFFIGKLERHASELGIPQATVDKMKATVEAARPDFQRLHQDLAQARQSGDLPRINAAETAMLSRRQALRAQIDGLLNSQQKAAIKQMMERHRAERTEKAGG